MRAFGRAVVAVGVVLRLVAPAVAGPLEDGLAAYGRGLDSGHASDYVTALRLLTPVAEAGNPGAQGILGTMYLDGNGIPQDYARAIKWFQRAADQDDIMAQVNLARMYENGQGTPATSSSPTFGSILPQRTVISFLNPSATASPSR